MKKIKVIFLVLTLCIVILPLIKFNFLSGSTSEIDNRYLTEIPIDNENSNNPSAWESYINDRIGYRDEMIDMYTTLNDKLFNMMVHPTYEYGKEGYVFFKLGYSVVDEEFIDNYVKHIKNIQTYCSERNVPFIYVIDPSKTSVYSQYLPNGYNFKNSGSDYLIKRLEENNIEYVNNIELLQEKSKTEQVFDKKYDAGHWNDLGGFYGVNNILSKMKTYLPDIESNKKEDFIITQSMAESLPVSKFKIDEIIETFSLKEEISNYIEVLSNEYSSLKLNENFKSFSYTENNLSNNSLKALFFQGSYLNKATKFLQPVFNECINVHAYQNIIDFDYYFNVFQPDIVVFESAEYATSAAYYNVDGMNDKCFNPVLNIDNATLIEANINTIINGNIATVNLDLEKAKYVYLVMNNKVFDFIWDEEDNSYSLDIDKVNISENYKIYIVN